MGQGISSTICFIIDCSANMTILVWSLEYGMIFLKYNDLCFRLEMPSSSTEDDVDAIALM